MENDNGVEKVTYNLKHLIISNIYLVIGSIGVVYIVAEFLIRTSYGISLYFTAYIITLVISVFLQGHSLKNSPNLQLYLCSLGVRWGTGEIVPWENLKQYTHSSSWFLNSEQFIFIKDKYGRVCQAIEFDDVSKQLVQL